MNSWDKRFLELAKLVSTWSKDPTTKVGCVLVRKNKTIASVGFNGLPQGIADTELRLQNRSLKHKLILHAEENALLFLNGREEGLTAYTWPVIPCSRCASFLIQARIQRVVSVLGAPSTSILDYAMTQSLFDEARIDIDLYEMPH
jgi:dCMP deaminase